MKMTNELQSLGLSLNSKQLVGRRGFGGLIRVLSGKSVPSRRFGFLMTGSPSDQHGKLRAGPSRAPVPWRVLLFLALLNEKGNLIIALGFLDVSLQTLMCKSPKEIGQRHKKAQSAASPSVPPAAGWQEQGGCCRPPTLVWAPVLLPSAGCVRQHGKCAPGAGAREEVPLPGKTTPMVILWGTERSGSSWQNTLCVVRTPRREYKRRAELEKLISVENSAGFVLVLWQV